MKKYMRPCVGVAEVSQDKVLCESAHTDGFTIGNDVINESDWG